MPEFKNKPNRTVIDADGVERWISRSIAIVFIPVFRLPNLSLYIPAGVRSSKTPDRQGLTGLICGYLDWFESGGECAMREGFEELGIDFSEYFDSPAKMQPYYVQSEPGEDSRQNVALRYRYLIDCEKLPILSKGEEVDIALWITPDSFNSYKYAFNHEDLIIEAFVNANSTLASELKFSAYRSPHFF